MYIVGICGILLSVYDAVEEIGIGIGTQSHYTSPIEALSTSSGRMKQPFVSNQRWLVVGYVKHIYTDSKFTLIVIQRAV